FLNTHQPFTGVQTHIVPSLQPEAQAPTLFSYSVVAPWNMERPNRADGRIEIDVERRHFASSVTSSLLVHS
ncbi:hypothetical protein, partial [Rhizobium sp. rho-13.1]|uniref:hypothetical protein n=1 Tax=Rhizobium sp. rho-13.1 TaxID=2506431 RepID=UPI00193E888D